MVALRRNVFAAIIQREPLATGATEVKLLHGITLFAGGIVAFG